MAKAERALNAVTSLPCPLTTHATLALSLRCALRTSTTRKSEQSPTLSASGIDLMSYTLKYREPGKRPNTERWATRPVESTREAIEWMNANKDTAFLPAFVVTNSWRRPETVAILSAQ